jgi:hypothetical protein
MCFRIAVLAPVLLFISTTGGSAPQLYSSTTALFSMRHIRNSGLLRSNNDRYRPPCAVSSQNNVARATIDFHDLLSIDAMCLGRTCFDCEEAARIVATCNFLCDGERCKQENEGRSVRFVGLNWSTQYLFGWARMFCDAENKCSSACTRYMFLVQVKAVPFT